MSEAVFDTHNSRGLVDGRWTGAEDTLLQGEPVRVEGTHLKPLHWTFGPASSRLSSFGQAT